VSPVVNDLLTGVAMAFGAMFWIWFFRRLYLNGWRPLIFVLIAIGWQRLKFYVSWIIFSRRRDKADAFVDEADRRRRHPISGSIEGPDR
jgi:hypothetical protein